MLFWKRQEVDTTHSENWRRLGKWKEYISAEQVCQSVPPLEENIS